MVNKPDNDYLLKQRIENLINQGYVEDAIKVLDKYEHLFKEDRKWLITTKSVTYLLKGKLQLAENLLLEGLATYPFNGDILFNLAYLFEQKKEYQRSYDFYLAAKDILNESENTTISDAIINLRNSSPTALTTKKKMVVFVRPGLDSFIDNIIQGLSNDYNVRKVTVQSYDQVEVGMNWADITWFEWCDELLIYATQLNISMKKKIICRIHGYEVYTENILKVNWSAVDHLIIVAPHIKRIFREKINELIVNDEKISLIFCGVDDKAYPLQIREKGYHIGYIGYINYKKNIPLTLKIFYELFKMDNRYSLNLAGSYQDERTKQYVEYFIKENELENHVVFEGWKTYEEKVEWFKKIDYMLISSIDEGLCFAAAESMLTGIKPVLHNCEGIKDHYKGKYIYNTVQEAISIILEEEYNSKEYREYIKENYSLNREITEIKQLIENLVNKEEEQEFDYKSYWEQRYKQGRNSGEGSYGLLASFKAEVINDFLKKNNIENVIEFGCGDGNQLSLIDYKKYTGLDISPSAIQNCRIKFSHDKSKDFKLIDGGIVKGFSADLVLCLDVLYHIINENDFINTLDSIFLSSTRYVILYTVLKEPTQDWNIHLKYRNIWDYTGKYDFKVKEIIKQKYTDLSKADFIIFEKTIKLR